MMILKTFTRNLFKKSRVVSPPSSGELKYAVCVDIECTCDSPLQIYPMEVIEIACLKLDMKAIKMDTSEERKERITNYPAFHSYVRPVINPKLTLFCQDLTGIMQTNVDSAETITSIVERLTLWLKSQRLIGEDFAKIENFAFASCGNFDLRLLSPIVRDCLFNNNLELPIYFREWINVKKTFVNHKKEWPKGLYHMMELVGEKPSGRLHSALDDCKNLARVIECLHLDGCKFHVTSKL